MFIFLILVALTLKIVLKVKWGGVSFLVKDDVIYNSKNSEISKMLNDKMFM